MDAPEKRTGFIMRIVIVFFCACLCVASPVWPHGEGQGEKGSLEEVMAAGDVYELCLVLEAGQQLDYAFTATQALAFNLHYHAEREVLYPVPEYRTLNRKAVFVAESEQEYCLMWTNEGEKKVTLSLEYGKDHR
jgi:hypothetical protein